MEISGRQRQLLQAAESLCSTIKALPLDSPSAASYPKLVELSRITRRFFESLETISNESSKAMWMQRGQWLKEELAGLVQERIYSPDEQTHWMNLVDLLLCSADAHDSALRGKAEAEIGLKSSNEKIETLEAMVENLTQRLSEAGGGTGGRDGVSLVDPRWARHESGDRPNAPALDPASTHSSDEVISLQSRARVLQQELERLQSETQAQSQQLSSLAKERDALRGRVKDLQDESASLADLSEERLVVITSLMLAQEEASKTSADHQRLQAHCKTLSANLEANSIVVEKLIGLNAELMDSANVSSWSRMNDNRDPRDIDKDSSAPTPPAARAPSPGLKSLQQYTSAADPPSFASAFAAFLSSGSPATSLSTPPPRPTPPPAS